MTVSYADATTDRISAIGDPAGGHISFEYDGSGKLRRIVDGRGRETSVRP